MECISQERVLDSLELSCRQLWAALRECRELKPGLLQEQGLFLTTEPAPVLSSCLSMFPFPHTLSIFPRRNTKSSSLPLLLNLSPIFSLKKYVILARGGVGGRWRNSSFWVTGPLFKGKWVRGILIWIEFSVFHSSSPPCRYFFLFFIFLSFYFVLSWKRLAKHVLCVSSVSHSLF